MKFRKILLPFGQAKFFFLSNKTFIIPILSFKNYDFGFNFNFVLKLKKKLSQNEPLMPCFNHCKFATLTI